MKAHRKEEKINFQGKGPKELILKFQEQAKAADRSVSAHLVKILKDHYKIN